VNWIMGAVILGGVFGSASATVESIDPEAMVVDIEVAVMEAGGSVVAHLSFDGETGLTLPLLDRGEGRYGIRTELEPKNYTVVFEAVGQESSDPVTLTQLGAELVPASGPATTEPDDEGLSDESQQLLWLAIALGAASLSVLAFWVLGGRNDDRTVPGAEEGKSGEGTLDEEE